MPDTADIVTIRENLQRIMTKKGVKPTTLSQRISTSKTLVKELMTKNSDVQLSTLRKLATALEVELGDLLALPRVPIVGKIGAGGSVAFLELRDEDHIELDESVPRPPGVSGKLIALIVEGSSMLPKYQDGDIIYVQRTHEGVLESDIGDDCAVRLTTGETYVKQLVRGATRVLFIMPRRSREMLDKVG